NRAYELQILAQKNIHLLKGSHISPEELAKKVTKIRPLAVVLAGSKIHNSLPLDWLPAYGGVIPEGYKCLRREGGVVILSSDKQPKRDI
ncbi:MAG: hypothetical protein PHQ96_04490, partial [Candidatus Omnitrophica bacterium]|nr:hypothetical protein [Candidatus Omnitrophota bacterium]